MLLDDANVQLGDYGFAVDDTDEGRTATALLSAKAVVGYRAPERIRGEKPDARSDLFAVGVCLFEMLAGRRPFTLATTIRLEEALGLSLRKANVDGAHRPVPVSGLAPLRAPGEAEFGRIALDHPSHARYRDYLKRTVEEPFALFLPG